MIVAIPLTNRRDLFFIGSFQLTYTWYMVRVTYVSSQMVWYLSSIKCIQNRLVLLMSKSCDCFKVITSSMIEGCDTADLPDIIEKIYSKHKYIQVKEDGTNGCQREWCSLYGMKFMECVSRTFCVKYMVIDDLIKEYLLMEGDDCSNSSYKQKRFILYW